MKKIFTLFAAFVLLAGAAVANANTLSAPITTPKDTVSVVLDNSNFSNKVIDEIASNGAIQIQGSSDEYAINMVFYTTTTLAGTYTDDDVYFDHDYFCLYSVEDSVYIEIPFSNLLPDAVITGDIHNCNALIHYVGTDSVLYEINFSYADPTAQIFKTFTANNLTIRPNVYYELYKMYMNVYCYDFQADDGELIITGVVSNPLADNAYGTWVLGSGDITLDIYDLQTHDLVAKYYSGTITIAKNGGSTSLTGSALFYGDVEYTFNVVGSAAPVEDVTTSDFDVLCDGRTILIDGAEGLRADVYDVAGRLVGSTLDARFDVGAAGIYVVRIGDKSFRVVAR